MANENVARVVADRIIAQLDAGVIPWRKPWRTEAPRSIRGRAYSGINGYVLRSVADEGAFKSALWITFNEAKARGWNVRKGEHGAPVVFWKLLDRTSKADATKTEHVPLLRYYTVFNLDQCDGVPEAYRQEHEAKPFEPLSGPETVLSEYLGRPGAPKLEEGGERAYYRPDADTVRLPARERFETAEARYATAFHECVHSTGHATRLGRDLKNVFGDHLYSREELVAEFGAAMLCAMTGIESQEQNSVAYVQNWRKALADDPVAIVWSVNRAEKAAAFVTGEAEEKAEAVAA